MCGKVYVKYQKLREDKILYVVKNGPPLKKGKNIWRTHALKNAIEERGVQLSWKPVGSLGVC